MKTALVFGAVATLALALSSGAGAQQWDAQGRCHANGKFAKAEVCANVPKPGGTATSTPKTAPAQKAVKGQRCKIGNKFAKCSAPGAVPVAAS